MKQKVFLITPPFTQLNTPYPATAYLQGFLKTQNIPSCQADLGIEVILKLFSKSGLTNLFDSVAQMDIDLSENAYRIFKMQEDYIKTIDATIHFLQNQNPTLAHLICERNYLPEAERFETVSDLEWAFGTMGIQDKARHLATLYIEDISDLIIEAIDPHFGFSRYAERLGRSASTFDELNTALQNQNTYIDHLLIEILNEKIPKYQPTLVALSAPFPGNLYSAFKCGQWLKANHPNISIALGGGFANTELRSINDTRVFEFIDFITLDDGERPILNLLEYLDGKRDLQNLKRTFALQDGEVQYFNGSKEPDFKQKDVGTPDYGDLFLDKYLSIIEIANPMHRLWNDGRWNKLTMAHGCYWGKCTFCDISLDYIKSYEFASAKIIVNRIEELIAQTGQTGFHFVDEAAPPAMMREVALEILRRKITVVWWTNIRFEKSFTPDLCKLLAASGCIAISGGLEVASDRLLELIQKGVTVTQVAQVCDNLTQAGVMTHAYLMYGFPTQTEQETIDSLEIVRQLFFNGVVQSGFWHQFAMTAHSPVGMHPAQFQVQKVNEEIGSFANNDIVHIDPTGCEHDLFSEGLKKSIFNYMHGIGFEFPLQYWFEFPTPKTSIRPNYIEKTLNTSNHKKVKANNKIVWLGTMPDIDFYTKNKKGKSIEMAELTFFNNNGESTIDIKADLGEWVFELLQKTAVANSRTLTYQTIANDFESKQLGDFSVFWNGYAMTQLREKGLLVL